jgi:AraC-like DNA-binding protein
LKGFVHIGEIPKPVLEFSTHSHHIWELVYYIKGEGYLTIEEKKYRFFKGVIILIPPNSFHSERSETGYRNIHLLFEATDLVKAEDTVLETRDTDEGDIYNILKLIYRTSLYDYPNAQTMIEHLFALLREYMLILFHPKHSHPLVEKLEKTLLNNLGNNSFDIHNEIKKLPISKDYFRRLFKEETGLPPLSYLHYKRIEQAKSFFRANYDKAMGISGVAYQCGFGDPYYFSRVFKKHTGKSPCQWVKGQRK